MKLKHNNEKRPMRTYASSRLSFIDTAKTILIILVIIGHVLIVLNPWYDKWYYTAPQAFIYTFHMPAFFVIGGAVINCEKWMKQSTVAFLNNRAQRLLLPYILFELSGTIFHIIMRGDSLAICINRLLTVRCNVGADWFLPAMFIGSVLLFIYVKFQNRVYGVITLILSLIVPMLLPHTQWAIVASRGMLAYSFLLIGFAGRKIWLSERLSKWYIVFFSASITVVVAIVGLKWGGNDFYSATVNNPMTLLLGGISGTILVLGIAQRLSLPLLCAIGKHTLVIMGTHQLVIYLITDKIPGRVGLSLGLAMLCAITLFEVPAIWIFERILRGLK